MMTPLELPRTAAVMLAFLALAMPALAGCSDGPAAARPGHDVEIHSDVPTEIRSGDTPPLAPAKTGRGHLVGVVVDAAIRPIEGALVRLPTLDLEEVTARDGSFAFIDLVPSAYFLQVNATGYRDAQAAVGVQEGEFTRAKVILTAIPPPEPYRMIQKFEGFVDVSATPYASGTFVCDACDFPFSIARSGLHTLIVEVAFEAPDVGNQRSFMAWLTGQRIGGTWLCVVCNVEADPLRIEARAEDLVNGTGFNLRAEPQTSPLPETNVRFHVYVTAFYHQAPPAGWSLVRGDP